MPEDIIILHMSTKNYDQMMYSSWDVVHDRRTDRQTDRRKKWHIEEGAPPKKFLPHSVTQKRARCADIRFKPIIGRVKAYSNSFVPLITQKWNTLPANIVNIDYLVKFGEKLNEIIKVV